MERRNGCGSKDRIGERKTGWRDRRRKRRREGGREGGKKGREEYLSMRG